ncbi:MAG: hypothetical protein IIV21_03850 [Bacteroidales bacterium]|nr:hypothetical protein [Bacteroidales bacterium]
MRTIELHRISLVDDYCKSKIEEDSNLNLCIDFLSSTILSIVKDADDEDNIDTAQLYNVAHVLRTLEELRMEAKIIKEGGEA